MIGIRRSAGRGNVSFSWLNSRHTFSFGHYYDPEHMGFGPLRVINEDRVIPGGGFGTHGHRDMEIISYVLDGALAHKDSLGNGSVIHPGDVQRMSAGTGIRHSEFNDSADAPVHFLQIWIEPAEHGIAPGYEQRHFDPEESRNRLRLVASPDGADGAVTIHQDARLFVATLERQASVRYTADAGRRYWLQVARGAVTLNQIDLDQGDGAAITDTESLTITGRRDGGEILLFDLRGQTPANRH